MALIWHGFPRMLSRESPVCIGSSIAAGVQAPHYSH
ncbi:protein of unknown function (plasmid) [Caballeronia sp. S22]